MQKTPITIYRHRECSIETSPGPHSGCRPRRHSLKLAALQLIAIVLKVSVSFQRQQLLSLPTAPRSHFLVRRVRLRWAPTNHNPETLNPLTSLYNLLPSSRLLLPFIVLLPAPLSTPLFPFSATCLPIILIVKCLHPSLPPLVTSSRIANVSTGTQSNNAQNSDVPTIQ